MRIELTRLETMLQRDRTVLIAGLVAVALVAWVSLCSMVWKTTATGTTGAMGMTSEMAMPVMQGWGAIEILLLFVMWAVMMVAMMVPSIAPLLLMFAWAHRRMGGNRVMGSAGILLLGYVLVWAGFSVLATLVQWGLHKAALLSSMMVSTSSVFGGLLLMAAGIFQFTPLKRACLAHCRSPLSFLMSHWQKGRLGTFIMGVKHGAYCVGCCWLLMTLLFTVGVMNLFWMAVIAVLVLAEKVTTNGDVIGRIAGGTLIVAGVALIAG